MITTTNPTDPAAVEAWQAAIDAGTVDFGCGDPECKHCLAAASVIQSYGDQREAAAGKPVGARWSLGARVQKKRGSSWRGTVVGFYSTQHTPIGYCVDSAFEPGSVQVWPEAALEDWDGDHLKGSGDE